MAKRCDCQELRVCCNPIPVKDDSSDPSETLYKELCNLAGIDLIEELKTELNPWIDPSFRSVFDRFNALIILSWVRQNKRLSFYFGSADSWSLRSWGADTKTEMIEGSLDKQDRKECWQWFLS